MDISKPITYRGHAINTAVLGTGRTLHGVTIENVDYSGVEAVGYTEKRAGADGVHASDVYLGPRYVEMGGHVYASDLADLFDQLHVLRAIFSPTSAYQASPGDQGFLPLLFSQPTHDSSFPPPDGEPDGTPGTVPLYMNVRPTRNLRFNINRDRLTAGDSRATAIPWSVQLFAKDPRVYVSPGQQHSLVGGPHALTEGDAINRGDYETPMNIQLVVLTPPVTPGKFVLKGLNGIDMEITIPDVSVGTTPMPPTIYRWFGDDRVLMTQDVTDDVTTRSLQLRMDLVKFNTKNRRPSVPADIDPVNKPFTVDFSYSSTVAVFGANSFLFWSEAFA